tara:strand:- start:160 stop:750 length:591 start_codon:yes stop_codon:yes gene_type:complete
MANNTAIYAVMALGLAGGVGWWYMNNQDKTPVGLVVTNQVEGARMPMGETSDGKAISANAIEGTWRESEDSLSVASESAEKPLMVIYHDGKPIHAEVVTLQEWVVEGAEMNYPDECCETPPCEDIQQDYNTEGCLEAYEARVRETTKKWLDLAKEHGATDESLPFWLNNVTEEKSTAQEAESVFGPMLSLQSHFVW